MFGRTDNYDYSLIRTTSKEALKRTALMVANYDIKKATEIYDYFAKDMPDLPSMEPEMPNAFDQFKATAANVIQWGGQNQDKIIGTINMVLGMMGKDPIVVPVSAPIDVPPPPSV
jgi:hypothetical protein